MYLAPQLLPMINVLWYGNDNAGNLTLLQVRGRHSFRKAVTLTRSWRCGGERRHCTLPAICVFSIQQLWPSVQTVMGFLAGLWQFCLTCWQSSR